MSIYSNVTKKNLIKLRISVEERKKSTSTQNKKNHFKTDFWYEIITKSFTYNLKNNRSDWIY